MEKYEALGLVRDIAAHAAADYAVPGGLVHYIELGLDDLSDVIENLLLLESVLSTVDSMLLHSLGHVGKLDDGVLGLILRHLLKLLGVDELLVGVLRSF